MSFFLSPLTGEPDRRVGKFWSIYKKKLFLHNMSYMTPHKIGNYSYLGQNYFLKIKLETLKLKVWASIQNSNCPVCGQLRLVKVIIFLMIIVSYAQLLPHCVDWVKIVKLLRKPNRNEASQAYKTFCTLSLHQNTPLGPKKPTQEPPQKRNSWFCTVLDPCDEMASGNSCVW